MSVDYRLLRADEIDAAADLWVGYHPGIDSPQHQAWRQEIHAIPHLLTHTWVAVDPDSALLSIIHYWPLTVYDADGRPQQVGRISHVFTREEARRQGHAARLLELTIAAMRDEGCRWSILSASDDARPLYQRYGWRTLPLRQTVCGGCDGHGQINLLNGYAVRAYDPRQEPSGWETLASIHRSYNAKRPLATVRDPAYWRFVAVRAGWWLSSGQAEVLIATRVDQPKDEPCAYVIALYSSARGFLVAELGALPDDGDALTALLSAVVQRPESRAHGGRLHLPHDPGLEATLAALCSDVEYPLDEDYMVRAIMPDGAARELDALATAPGNVMWALDDI